MPGFWWKVKWRNEFPVKDRFLSRMFLGEEKSQMDDLSVANGNGE